MRFELVLELIVATLLAIVLGILLVEVETLLVGMLVPMLPERSTNGLFTLFSVFQRM